MYGPLHMAEQRQGDQLAPTYSSSMRIRGVALRTCRKRWTIGRGGERESGISVLMALLLLLLLLLLLFLFLQLFISALAGGLYLESKRQQVSSRVQDFSPYSSQSYLWCGPDFLFLHSLFQAFWDRSRCINHKWYHRQLHVSQHF